MPLKPAEVSPAKTNLDRLLEKNPDRIASLILGLDDSILMSGVVNNLGELVGFDVRDEYEPRFSDKQELYYDMAARSAVMYSTTMSQTHDVLEETDAFVLIRRNTKTYFTLVRSKNKKKKDYVISVCFEKEKNSSEINRKVREMFGLSS